MNHDFIFTDIVNHMMLFSPIQLIICFYSHRYILSYDFFTIQLAEL